ncbi:alpha/beta fold hydrolase [Cellulomonas sp. ATA003]|uniref:alpha/beta fold hydrolase n=1 Tax=Cellulomonas sp. ATA003 TaxID=3073064 RepID=UPI002873E754|nr:alpha/beta fold hydrolase [Cellulomonas sp. ATA003]WNB84835.1 alpha/beta fold hydrolase [Cellulomonas sp. ATA003]
MDVPRAATTSAAGADVGVTVDTWHVLDNRADVDGPVRGTLLCVHGNPTWSYLWRDLLRAGAAAGWRVVAVDQLGMGFSARTGRVHRLADRIADLGALTDTLDLTGAVVSVGHDWGGPVSLGWAVAHPDLLAGVVLTNTAVYQDLDGRTPAPLRLAMTPGVLRASTVTTPAFLETTLAIAHPPLDADVREAFRAPYRTTDRRHAIGDFVADIPVDADHPSRPTLEALAAGVATLRVPALLLWGPRDPVFGEQFLADLLQRLPHADVHRFEGAGHLLPQDADVAGAVVTWLGERFPVRTTDAATTDAATTDAATTDAATTDAATTDAATTDAATTSAVPTDAVLPDELRAPDGVAPRTPPTAPFAPLWHALEKRRDDDGVALVEMAPPGRTGPRTITWSLLARRVDEIAHGLVADGVRPGHRVALLVPPGADLTAILYACLRIGAVVVVADAGLGLRGLSRAVRGARPDVVIGIPRALAAARALGWAPRRVLAGSLAPAARAALGVESTLVEVADRGRAAREADGASLPEPAADDDAAILFTSGSTGPAKGVAYTHARLAAMARAVGATYGIGPGSALVAAFAPFALLGPALGATCASPDMDVTAPRTLTAAALADAVAAIDAAVVFASPAALTSVVAGADTLDDAGRRALAGVRLFLSAGAPVPPELLAAAGRLMPAAEPHTPYGMTEALPITDISLDGIRAAGQGEGVCVGRPVAGADLAISALDPSGAATGPVGRHVGVTGEILVSAPHVMARYDRLWLTHRAARRDAGWHRTGDVGHLDDEGRLWVEGRLAHVVTTPDGVLTPVGIERRVEGVDGVARAAAVGVGPRGVQAVVVVVETQPPAAKPGLADLDLTARVRAAVDVPVAAVLVTDALPTDVRHNSKIERTRLARWAEGVLAGGRTGRP